MIPALALMAGTTLIGFVAHHPLRWLSDRCRDPLTVMACWVACIGAVLVTFTGSAMWLVMPGDHPGGLAEHFAHGCWLVLAHGQAPALDEAAGALGLAGLAVAASRMAREVRHGLRVQAATHREHLSLMRIIGGSEAGQPVLWLEHREPFAYSVRGRPGVIVASSGLRSLPAAHVSAVLSHERAHLRRHHHLLLTVARALAVAIPFLPLVTRAPAALSLLVELDADIAAVRTCGRGAVEAALLAVTRDGAGGSHAALAMAGGDVPHRLLRIVADPGARPLRRVTMRAAAVVGPALLPAVFGLSTLLAALAMACPDT